MAFSPQTILGHQFADTQQSYVQRDAILYALGIGLGADPLAARDLKFLLETKLDVLPTMAVTLGTLGMWVRDERFGIDFTKLVHSAQSAVFHAVLPPAAEVIAQARIASLTDRGPGKGAVLVVERSIRDAGTSQPYCTLRQTLLLRGDGGFGGEPPERSESPAPPARAPDHEIAYPVSPRAALIYRLSGDWNPLHADPAFAAKAGFERPILHGLASYGIAGWVVLNACADADASALAELSCRFSGVIYPGDSIEFSIWHESGGAIFEARVGARKVLDQGYAKLQKSSHADANKELTI